VMGYRFQVTSPAGLRALDEPAPGPARQPARTDLQALAQPHEAELAVMSPAYTATLP
jgi:hypothetical protein